MWLYFKGDSTTEGFAERENILKPNIFKAATNLDPSLPTPR
jgi:hypothetical protein